MRKSDVSSFSSRTEAVYECLAKDFVDAQLAAGTKDVIVTLLEMSDHAMVVFEKAPLDPGLSHTLRRRGRSRGKSHGNYLPVLQKAYDILHADAQTSATFMVLFLSDGAPSDQTVMTCAHGVQVWQPTSDGRLDKKGRPALQQCGPVSVFKCRAATHERLRLDCFAKINQIGDMLGRERTVISTVAFGNPSEDFQTLKEEDIVRQTAGWFLYHGRQHVQKFVYQAGQLRPEAFEDGATGLAFYKEPFAEGVERFVYRCTEIEVPATHANAWYDPESHNQMALRRGVRLVAKEAKHHENLGERFQTVMARTQGEAAALAAHFNVMLDEAPALQIYFLPAVIYKCSGPFSTTYPGGEAWELVEPELEGKFFKWNNNGGEITPRDKLPQVSEIDVAAMGSSSIKLD